jgi:hypothetical protein
VTDGEPELPSRKPILNNVCIYCHEEKGSYHEADLCEIEHEKTMSHMQLQTRHAAYKAKFLDRGKKT